MLQLVSIAVLGYMIFYVGRQLWARRLPRSNWMCRCGASYRDHVQIGLCDEPPVCPTQEPARVDSSDLALFERAR